MNHQMLLERYIENSNANLIENSKILNLLKKKGISENFIFHNLKVGFSGFNLIESIGNNEEIKTKLITLGLLKDDKEVFANHLTIPVYDENKAIVNIVFYNLESKTKNKMQSLNNDGIFNNSIPKNYKNIIFTHNPLDTLALLQNNIPNVTFIFSEDRKYHDFIKDHGITKAVFCYEGNARLFHDLTSAGVSTERIEIDFDQLIENKNSQYLEKLLSNEDIEKDQSSDVIREIENGFIFSFSHLNYRVIGNFHENSLQMKANIKAFKDNETFVDAFDLCKNRERQNFIFNLMDKFNFRDQIQLENDLKLMIETIEKHKEKKEQAKKKIKPELTEEQKTIGNQFLTNKNLINEIIADIDKMGYVRESKNKILMYLVMTSRLLENPLNAVIISRSGAGKSQLLEIVEKLCPPEELESISDMSRQSLYYFGTDDLKHKFIVVGEKEGSKNSSYPLRELITKKSLTKAVPVKDVTGQIKTMLIKVNGPIALAETTTSGDINPENLNRCFVIGVDESEDQTRLIQHNQRIKYTLEGQIENKNLNKIIEKHIYAQRLLKKVLVVNPYAPFLTFPSSRIQTRRDNDKLLKLINVIAFLHQYQREVKIHQLNEKEYIEYIECTIDDYRLAYDLLSDGILDDTLDDLPRPARELLEVIKKYLFEFNQKNNTPIDKIIFDRKAIREYSAWSFAQVRNNFRTLTDYEYIQLVKNKNGVSNQYKLSAGYSDPSFLKTILSPEELETKINERAEHVKHNLNVQVLTV